MIIDRIFSLVNKRTLEPKWAGKVANASEIKHPKFHFERQQDGRFVVEPLAENSNLRQYFYEIRIVPANGTWQLVNNLNSNPIMYADIFLALVLAYLLFISVAVFNPFPLLIFLVLLGAIAVQQKVVCHFIFNDVEYALFKAEYITAD